jgi:hypothetical protein
MLYEVYCKILIEADEQQEGNSKIKVDSSRMNASCSFRLGNLVKISFELKFFQQNESAGKSEVGDFFREIFLNISSSTFTNNIMRNLSFVLLVDKLSAIMR